MDFKIGFRNVWIKPSTRLFIQEARRTQGYSILDGIHGYIYARWPYLYIRVAVGELRFARIFKPAVNWIGQVLIKKSAAKKEKLLPTMRSGKDPATSRLKKISLADTYHGKVVPTPAAEQLVTLNREIRLTNLEKIIPYGLARDIILQNPDHIVALDCPCRAARSNPCLPLDVCLVVGEPFASFITEHHPSRSRRITSEEAVAILRSEKERGHVHHAFFKDAMLGRFYAICNCCPCCCGAMQAHRHGIPMLASSGYTVRIDKDLCTECGCCVAVCPFGALTTEEESVAVNPIACMGCGVCVSTCAKKALSLMRDPSKGEPLEMKELMANTNRVT